jgi:aminopeptidase N
MATTRRIGAGWTAAARWTTAIVVATALVATPTAAGADRGHEPCTAGAAGIGDPYFPTYGNGGYDVREYDLDITYDPATDRLDGEAAIRARATQALCSFHLDLVGLEVTEVSVDHRPATWTRDGQELIVTPRRPLRDGQRFTVEVTYGGVPVTFEIPGFGLPAGFMATTDGAIVAGQPESATAWFPVNDHPLDKASYAFDVTVPAGVEVVANGFLRGERTRNGWTTWRWVAREPMASYLATIDIGAWDVTTWRTGDGLPVYDAVDSAITGGLRAEIDSSLSRQDEVIALLSDAFGPYPFRTAGGIVDDHDDLFFALETQTRSVYSKYFWLDQNGNPVNGDSVVAHEMAHQWFGDDLAVARWQDIWLNEGFATYAEWLWAEYEGQATPDESFQATYDAFPADDPFWSVTIGDPGVTDLFADPVYFRGAMTLHALRQAVGDDAFWEIVRTWAAEHHGGNVTTEQFIALAEETSGQQLDDLFTTWLFTPSRPELNGAAAAAAAPLAGSAGSDTATAWVAATQARLARGRS